MEIIKVEWLEKISGAANLNKAMLERMTIRDALTSKLAKDLEVHHDQFFELSKIKMVGTDLEDQQVLNYEVRDQTTEFDLDEFQDGYDFETDEDRQKVEDATARVNRMIDELSSQEMVPTIDPVTGEPVMIENPPNDPVAAMEPLFSREELGREVYQQMVREGLFPETFVPDEFSQTRKMLDASFEYYEDRLEEEGQHEPGFLENLMGGDSTALTVVKAGLDIAAATLNAIELAPKSEAELLKSAWGKEAYSLSDISNVQKAQEIVEWTANGLELIDTSISQPVAIGEFREGGQTEPVDKSTQERSNKAKLVAGHLVRGVASVLGAKLDEAGLGIPSSNAFSSSVSSSDIADCLAVEVVDRTNIEGIRDLLADGIKAALLACDPQKPNSTDVLNAAGTTIRDEFKRLFDAPAVLSSVENSKYGDALTAICGYAETAIDGNTLSELNRLNSLYGEEIRQVADEQMTAEFERATLERDRQEQEFLERMADEKDAEAFAGMVAMKLRQLQKQKMFLDMGAKITGLGFDVAAKVFGPLAIGGQAIKMALQINEAVKRHRDFNNWAASKQDMLNAASAFSSAVANFVYNAKMQETHYEINAALEGAKMLAAIVECTGVGAIIGKAIGAAASGIGAIEAIIYEQKQKRDIENAWKTFKMALIRPQNRKLGLEAVRSNPTLAKYAVAWGAYILKDPLVSDFMGTCGLDANTLRDPNSNVKQVVQYLEARMPDDNVIVGRQAVADWLPSEVVITASCWTNAKQRALRKADLVDFDSREVESLLLTYKPFEKVTGDDFNGIQDKQAEWEQLKGLLTSISQLVTAIVPKRVLKEKNKPDREIHHAEMQGFLADLKKGVDDRLQEVSGWTPA